jgi:hypothetical protein
MDKVYLLSTEAVHIANIGASLAHIGALNVHDCAWVLPWPDSFDCLQARIRAVLHPGHTRVVIAEITGDYIAI